MPACQRLGEHHQTMEASLLRLAKPFQLWLRSDFLSRTPQMHDPPRCQSLLAQSFDQALVISKRGASNRVFMSGQLLIFMSGPHGYNILAAFRHNPDQLTLKIT